LTLLGYGLLLVAAPTLGASAVLAVILAYARRDGSSPLIASHCRFQIRIFWIGLGLAAAAAALGLTGLADAARLPPTPLQIPVSPHAQLISYAVGGEADDAIPADVQVFSDGFGRRGLIWRTRAILEGAGAMVLFAFAGLWGLGAPLYGAARLASGRAMGHSPK
jgi:hypothetical protein